MARKGRRTKEEYQELLNEGKSIKEISEEFGINEGSVKENLSLYGIKPPTQRVRKDAIEMEAYLTPKKFAKSKREVTYWVDPRTGKRWAVINELLFS